MKRRWKALEKLGFSGLAIFGIPPLLHFEEFCQHYTCRTGRETCRAQKTSSPSCSGPRNIESANGVACFVSYFCWRIFGAKRTRYFLPVHSASRRLDLTTFHVRLDFPAQACTSFPASRQFRVRARNGSIPAALESSREAGPFENTCSTSGRRHDLKGHRVGCGMK